MNLKKVNLIIGREFLIRVRKKSFLVATFVTPLLMAALVTVPTLMATLKDSNEKRIEVIDPTGIAQQVLENGNNTEFIFKTEGDLEYYKTHFAESGLHAVCVIEPAQNNSVEVRMYSTAQIDSDVQRYIAQQIGQEVENRKLASDRKSVV